jgi:S-adenosylmethionine-dependent methyltransferase
VQDRFAGKAAWFDDHYAAVRGRVRLDLVLERLRDRLPPPPARIIDVGGGTGAFAVPLAAAGYEVTLVDASEEWLARAAANAKTAGVPLTPVHTSLEALRTGDFQAFDAVLCHAVLMYVDKPVRALRTLRTLAGEGALLSLLEKNRDGLALRPGLDGDYEEARRLLTDRVAVGRMGIENRAYANDEWLEMLTATGWQIEDWAGVRLFSDVAPDDVSPDRYAALRDLERAAGVIEPYRSVSRLVHFIARAARVEIG